MIRAGVGHSQQPQTGAAVEEAARRALARAGIARADLALIFFTSDHAARGGELTSALIRSAGTDCVFGSSGAGLVTGEGEIEGGSAVAVLAVAG